MLKTIKRVLLGSLSVLGISLFFWVFLLLNPSWSYAHSTSLNHVTVYHNFQLENETEAIINNAIDIIKKSELFDENIVIELCINDDKIYPNLHPISGEPMAFALLNKTVFKNCALDFKENSAVTQWEVNNYERRRFNLTWLLAHEFTHNLQYHSNSKYVIKSTLGTLNWKLEGHAEYIAREFQCDGLLKNKIRKFQIEEQRSSALFPVFELQDGTKQILSYYKYALVIQYLIEEKGMNFTQVCAYKKEINDIYTEMMEWSNRTY